MTGRNYPAASDGGCRPTDVFRFVLFLLIAAFLEILPSPSIAGSWPDLETPAPAVGGGAQDAAVIVAIEHYAFVAHIPGAKANANAWYDYFIKTRRIPFKNVFRRVDSDVTAEDMSQLAARAASSLGQGGTLWFVFIGHGAPSMDGKDGLLVGVDAQQKAESLEARGLPHHRLLSTLTKSQAGTIVAVIDACFSGRGVEGSQLVAGLQPLLTVQTGMPEDPRLVVLSAAKGNEFAGQLPGVQRPAFSYLILGGLRGWADEAGDGNITADKLHAYADGVLSTMVKDRTQTPVLLGDGSKLIARSSGEKGPDLAELAKQEAPGSNPFQFRVSALPELPSANAPSISAVPSATAPTALTAADTGIDFGSVDVASLEQYDAAVKFEKGPAAPEEKAEKWRQLGAAVPTYAKLAAQRAQDWTKYAEQAVIAAAVEFDKSSASPMEKAAKWREVADKVPSQQGAALKNAREWGRYASELVAIEKAHRKRAKFRDLDYPKLRRLLALSVVGATDKQNWSEMFVKAYGRTCGDNPYIADIAPFLSSGTRAGIENITCAATAPPAPEPELRFSPGTMNLDLNYPGAGLRVFLSGKTALEGRAQDDGHNLAAGGRLYWYPMNLSVDNKFWPYLCAEGDYVSFKGTSSRGTGWAGGAFAGIEFFMARSFSLQFDAGGAYMALKDKATAVIEDNVSFTLNFGVNLYFTSGTGRQSGPEHHQTSSRVESSNDRVREHAQKAQEELDRSGVNP